MSEHTTYYLHLDNGDYSIKEETIGDLLSTIEFELEKGGAKQLMVTKEFQESHPLHTTDKLIAENKRLREALTYYKALYGNTGYSVTKESAQIAYNMARQALNESE